MPNLYDRFSIASLNLIQAHPRYAAQALFQPTVLPPGHRKTLGEEKGGGITGFIMDTITNPLFAMGMIMSMK